MNGNGNSWKIRARWSSLEVVGGDDTKGRPRAVVSLGEGGDVFDWR